MNTKILRIQDSYSTSGSLGCCPPLGNLLGTRYASRETDFETNIWSPNNTRVLVENIYRKTLKTGIIKDTRPWVVSRTVDFWTQKDDETTYKALKTVDYKSHGYVLKTNDKNEQVWSFPQSLEDAIKDFESRMDQLDKKNKESKQIQDHYKIKKDNYSDSLKLSLIYRPVIDRHEVERKDPS